MRKVLITLSLLASSSLHAWVQSDNATIDQFIHWQDNFPAYIKLSSGVRCYIPNKEKSLFSLALSTFMSGKSATFHCWDNTENTQGWDGHRLHRIIVNK